ncbi:hypothetical protein NARC_30257 [Candidatus Nitrosocosmicus arcticus]|uniref:Uncharacterized protein n=1 Tax=Candidatus Nitrosocosmicus arcticus TaxID=2035267 RepID=A0A557SY73_9ARCH|nr:hypothetical protein NARC_30257 [Candidatus Nitrosocosmicus arcticus]
MEYEEIKQLGDSKVELWMCETEHENGRKGITGGMMNVIHYP